MITKIIEATQSKDEPGNWGKFLVGRLDTEWLRRSRVAQDSTRLLMHCGWSPRHVWVLDLQTGEGAFFNPGGLASADLERHRVWVCPLFEPFLTWLYTQDLANLDALPDLVELPEAEFAMYGRRRRGPE